MKGNEVTFIARGAHLEAIRVKGSRCGACTGIPGLARRATDKPAECRTVDLVSYATKPTIPMRQRRQSGRWSRAIRRVVSLQKEWDSAERIGAVVGWSVCWAG